MKELKSLTINNVKYDSFPDQTARGKANITTENIKTALGYTPADAEVVAKQSEAIDDLQKKIDNEDYVLTEADMINIAQKAADMINDPIGGGLDVELTAEETAELESTISELQNLKTSNTSIIAFLTDLHIGGGTPTKIKKAVYGYNSIVDAVKTDLLLYGGDYMDNNPTTTKEQALSMYANLRSVLSLADDTCPAAVIKGNHDDNTMYTDYINGLIDKETFWKILGNIDEDRTVRDAGSIDGCYGYYDIPNQKIRVFYANTVDIPQKLYTALNKLNYRAQWDTGISVEQIQFIADHLQFDEAGWRVMVFSHHPIMYNIANENGCGVRADRGGAALLELLDKFNTTTNVGSITITGTDFEGTVSYDFSKNDDCKVIACVNGHIHRDVVDIYNNSFFCISTRAVYGHPSHDGHISSSAYFVVDRNNDKLHLLYNGDGEENVFDYGSLTIGGNEDDGDVVYKTIENPYTFGINNLNYDTGEPVYDAKMFWVVSEEICEFTKPALIDLSGYNCYYNSVWFDTDGTYVGTGSGWTDKSKPLEVSVGQTLRILARNADWSTWTEEKVAAFTSAIKVYIEEGGEVNVINGSNTEPDEPDEPTHEEIESPFEWQIGVLNDTTGELTPDSQSMRISTVTPVGFTTAATIDMSANGNDLYQTYWYDADGNYIETEATWVSVSVPLEIPVGKMIGIKVRHNNYGLWDDTSVNTFADKVSVYVEEGGEPYYPTPEIPMEVIESPYTFGINNLNYDTGEPVYDAKMFWVVSNEICAFTKPAKINLSGYNCRYNIVLFDADGNYVGLGKDNWTDKSITYEVPDGNYVRIFARNADWSTWTEEKVIAFTSAVEVSVQVGGEVQFLQLLLPEEPDEPEVPEEPDGVTTVLYEDYSPNGESFIQTVEDIDFAAGDYIKAEIDISTCVNSMENILSFGTSIASWNNTANIHCYNNSGNAIQIGAVDTTKYSTAKNISSPNGICVLLLNKNGVYVNGTLLTAERFNNAQGAAEDPTGAVYTSVMNVIPTLSSIEIGSAEGAKRSNATYNYIKVVRMNESDEPDVPDVPDEPDEPTIELGKPLENVIYAIGVSASEGGVGMDVYGNAPRMTALVTYGDKPVSDINNKVGEEAYFIAIPSEATKITVTCPNFIYAFQFLKYENNAYTKISDPGWQTLGGGSSTFEAGTYSHVAINYKNSSNTNIPADTDTSGFSIQFD